MNKINLLLIPFFFFNCYYLASMEEQIERYNGNHESKFNKKFTEYAEDLHDHHTRFGYEVFLISYGNLKEELEGLPATHQIEALSIMINHVVPKNQTVAEGLYSIVDAFFSNACAQGYGEIIAALIQEKIIIKQQESTLQWPVVERLTVECSTLIKNEKEKKEKKGKEKESNAVRDFCKEVASLGSEKMVEDPEVIENLLHYLGVPLDEHLNIINQSIASCNDPDIESALKKYLNGEVGLNEIDERSFIENIADDTVRAFCNEIALWGAQRIAHDPEIIGQTLVNVEVPLDEHLAIINQSIEFFNDPSIVSALKKYAHELNKNTDEQTDSKKSLQKSTKKKNKSNLMGRVYKRFIDQFH